MRHWVLPIIASGLFVLQAHGQAQPQPLSVLPANPPPVQTGPPLPALTDPTPQPTLASPSSSPGGEPTTSSYKPGEGLSVTLLNDTCRVNLFAQFSALAIFSTDRPFAPGLPLLLLPPSPYGLNTNTFDLHARQSAFGGSFSGPEVLGLTPGAFFLGFIQNDNLTNDAYGLLPYQAYGELKNEQWRIAGGLQSDVFNPGKPTIISLGSLFGSGNTGSFRGQIRVENFLNSEEYLKLTTQLAISEPVATIVTGNRRILEDNGWPNIEGRIATALGTPVELAGGRKQRPAELGISGVVGQLRTSKSLLSPEEARNEPNRAVIDTWGFGVDGQWAITSRFGVEGELYIGQGLGEYNGAILQNFNPVTYQAIRARGGWGEVYYYFTDALHLHTGYGIDAPLRKDLASIQIARNQTYFANLIWNASKVLQISFEVDYRKTDYIAFPNADGFIFLTEMLWRF